ncbi:MAG: hypothetical protein N2484_04930 [Clostridia bacterium]|nr:hypothetical protein [Clostridia bacterium]
MNKKKSLIIGVIALIIVACGIISVYILMNSKEKSKAEKPGEDSKQFDTLPTKEKQPQIKETAPAVQNQDVKERVEKLLKEIVEQGPQASSNPYDYMKNSKSFDALVAMGEPALKYMLEGFAQSNENGLKEYIMACACAKIMGVYHEQRGIGTNDGREWFYKYGTFEKEKGLQEVDADFEKYVPFKYEKGEKVVLPEDVDKKNLEEVIGAFLLVRNRSAYGAGEKAIEAHKILGAEEKAGMTNVYLQVAFGWFGFENGIFTDVSGGGDIVRMRLQKDSNGEYEVLEYKQAMDGGMYAKSIREMFPKALADKVLNRNNGIGSELWELRAVKAKEYLNSIQRQNAPVAPYVKKDRSDEKATEAIYRVTSLRKDFPEWNGTREKLFKGGGPAPGTKIRCILETRCIKEGEGQYSVALTKTWGLKVNDAPITSVWKYKVTGDKVELVEEKDNDNRIKTIK